MSVVIPERLAALGTIHLGKGSHSSYESGHCAMEVVAWLAGLDYFHEGLLGPLDAAQRATLLAVWPTDAP